MNSSRMNWLIAIVAGTLLPAVGAQAVAVRYVALDGSGANGKSWATAYKTIQAALNDSAMVGGSEIHVKKGVYAVTTPIEVKKAVRIYGGYSGSGEMRDWTGYQTFIDGGAKSPHCFVVKANAIIDGFAIFSGSGVGNLSDGGGVNISNCAAIISNCVFKYNHTASFGGAVGMFMGNGAKILDCTFDQNTATQCGGAIYAELSTGVQISKCTFSENAAGDSGGAIHIVRSVATVTGCLFETNEAATEVLGVGGGILNEESNATINNCVFRRNRAPYGVGVFNYFSGATIDGCLFADCDTTTLAGGGVYNRGSSPTIRSCLFQGNAVRDQGGGLMSDGSGGRIINCIFSENYASFGGGGIFIGKSEDPNRVVNPQFVNCTLYGNGTNWRGGAVCSEGTNSNFTNCIIWGNTADDANAGVYSYAGWSAGQPAIRYSDVQGDSTYPGTGNLRVDPRLADPEKGDFGLEFDSPCIDAGNNVAIVGVNKDYEDAARVVDGDGKSGATVDMGACELQGIPDHLKEGEIIQGIVYDDPSDSSATYLFTLRLKTDNVLTAVEFQAPGGAAVYKIPSDSQTSTGSVETYHRIDGRTHVWEYRDEVDSLAALGVYGDGLYRITAYYRNGTQAQTEVKYLVPKTTKAISQPKQKPEILSPAYNAVVGSPVTFSWEACTDAAANKVYLTITKSSTDQDVVSDALGKSATQSDAYVLEETAYEAEIGFASLYDVQSSDKTPFQCAKVVLVGHRFDVPYTAVFRFWSPVTGAHFYTTSQVDKERLIKEYMWFWVYEGVAFNACSTKSDSWLMPVYRFWSGRVHYYTISESERTKLLTQYSRVWKPEGIAFYAYPEGLEPSGARPVHHFWNAYVDAHFFTIDDAEADLLFTQYSDAYAYQGVAFYAFSP